MVPFTTLTSRAIPMPIDDVDTDQIIPARFLTGTSREGLGQHLFSDLRRGPEGTPKPDFPLNRREYEGAQILLAGNNFGCGSSREHAPWALVDYGFRAVLSGSFADIFYTNALKNGLLPVCVDAASLAALFALVREEPSSEVTLDLASQELRWPGGSCTFPIDPFAKRCLLFGVDQLGYILRFLEDIAMFEERHHRVAGG